jgi:predicted RNA polymerase sigma factor
MQVLYLMFNEGYLASSGPEAQSVDLTREAIRLTRMLRLALPYDGEVAGLLALMLLTDSRRAARTDPLGELVPLDEQDRTLWSRAFIEEGIGLISQTLVTKPLGPYQVQAAIAAVHAEATNANDTDWPQILALYDVLERIAPSPVVALNRAVAVGMVRGPRAGLEILESLDGDERLGRTHRVASVRASFLELAGDLDAARDAYRFAAEQTQSEPERRFLEQRMRRLGG